VGRGELAQRGDGVLGAEFLVGADKRVQRDNGANDDRVEPVAKHCGQRSRKEQQPDEQRLELAQEDAQRPDGSRLLKHVWSRACQACRGLSSGKPHRRRIERGENLLMPQEMP
jgi:hypothetical protein